MKLYEVQVCREEEEEGKIVTEKHFVTAPSMLVVVDAFRLDMMEEMAEVVSIVKHADVSQNLTVATDRQ